MRPRSGSISCAQSSGTLRFSRLWPSHKLARKRAKRMARGLPKPAPQSRVRQITTAPLPAPETDSSLPPPASLAPDTTTAPEPLLPLPGTSTEFGYVSRCRHLCLSRRIRLTGALKASLATVFCLALSGCLGYHVGPVKPYYLRDVHSIAVPTFKNRTLVPRVEVLVTDTVIKQLQQDGTFQIENGDKADATLTGEVSRIVRAPARSVRGNVLATTEFALTLSVKVLANRKKW